jgi:SAM-dependent methyltransferase
MAEVDFLGVLHRGTKRDYVQRVIEHDKAACAEVARRWGFDYWDGDRKFGYGGYRYDGRWRRVAEAMSAHYGLKSGDRILDVGCGKAFLLYEFTQIVPGIEIAGIDISDYAIAHAKDEVKPYLQVGTCTDLPYESASFDLVYSITTLHNLHVHDLKSAAGELQRVGRRDRYICVESYRNEQEKANLLYWQLTCQSFYTPEEWQWLLNEFGYVGDVGFIFFE